MKPHGTRNMQHAFHIDPSLVPSRTLLCTLGQTYPIRSTCCQGSTYGACQAALHILRYLSNTVNQGIVFPNVTEGELLTVYSDADWAGDVDTSRSTTGYIVYLWGAPIGWQSHLQPTVATSTMEAEYMAAYAAIQEIVWIRGVMTKLGIKDLELSRSTSSTILNMDSKRAIGLTQNPVHHKRSKYIGIKYHWIREQI